LKYKLVVIIIYMLNYSVSLTAQSIDGVLLEHKKQIISLTGFNYYQSFELARDTIDASGRFKLSFDSEYKGMAILKTQDNASLVLCVLESDIFLTGKHLSNNNSLKFINSPKNEQFLNLGQNFGWRSQVYDAWQYLQIRYQDPQASHYKNVLSSIIRQVETIEKADRDAIKNIDSNSYLAWFMTLKKEINDIPKSIRLYPKRIPHHITTFREINFGDTKFKTSGLFKELIEAHYFMLENMGKPLDAIYEEMNTSTQHIINTLKQDPKLLNKVAEHLLNYFEERSLYNSAAYLSEELLSDNACVLEQKISSTMQKYHTLKKGRTAPNIILNGKQLNDYNQPVLIVFGANTCSHCKADLEELSQYYETWKAKKNLEVIYISLDTDEEVYNKAYKNYPWQKYCDYKGWETQSAKDYFVDATPTYILLDKNQVILEHPRSLKQVDAWVEYRL
jgi:thiol-disulfide isomerase/thioredoxin